MRVRGAAACGWTRLTPRAAPSSPPSTGASQARHSVANSSTSEALDPAQPELKFAAVRVEPLEAPARGAAGRDVVPKTAPQSARKRAFSLHARGRRRPPPTFDATVTSCGRRRARMDSGRIGIELFNFKRVHRVPHDVAFFLAFFGWFGNGDRARGSGPHEGADRQHGDRGGDSRLARLAIGSERPLRAAPRLHLAADRTSGFAQDYETFCCSGSRSSASFVITSHTSVVRPEHRRHGWGNLGEAA